MPVKQKPEIINLTSKDFDDVESRVTTGMLTDNDKKLLLSIMRTYEWLFSQLQTAKFSMYRLKKMFGFKTEKNPAKKPKITDIATTNNVDDQVTKQAEPAQTINNVGEPPTKK